MTMDHRHHGAHRSGHGPEDDPRVPRRGSHRGVIAGIALGTLVLGASAVVLLPGHRGSASAALLDSPTASSAGARENEAPILVAERRSYDFGDIPIDGGTVQTEFSVKNIDTKPARIVATYTSCMCTTATLGFPDGMTAGPFGMPGHDLPVTLDHELGADQVVTVTVRFDPAAHGPDAIGPVHRAVDIRTDDGQRVTVAFSANVVKG